MKNSKATTHAYGPKTKEVLDRLNSPAFIENNAEKIIKHVNDSIHSKKTQEWKHDIKELLEKVEIDRDAIKADLYVIKELIVQKSESLKVFLDTYPVKEGNHILSAGSKMYTSLVEYIKEIEKVTGEHILRKVALINRMIENKNKKDISYDPEKAAKEIKDYILKTASGYHDALSKSAAIEAHMKKVLHLGKLHKKRIETWADYHHIKTEAHPGKGLDWGYIWLQLRDPKTPEDEGNIRVLESGKELAGVRVIGKIDLPHTQVKKVVAMPIVEPVDESKQYIGQNIPMQEFLSKLSITGGYAEVDNLIATQEMVLGRVLGNVGSNETVTIGKESSDINSSLLNVFIPKDGLPNGKWHEPGTIIPIGILGQVPSRAYDASALRKKQKNHVTGYYYTEQHANKVGNMGHLLNIAGYGKKEDGRDASQAG